MNKSQKNWYSLTISFSDSKAKYNTPLSLAENTFETLSVKCSELESCGTEIRDSLLIAYFTDNSWKDTIAEEMKHYCESLAAIGSLPSVPDFKIDVIADDDWAENWKLHFQPVAIGKRFLVVPPWENERGFPGRVTIIIEPGMVFGNRMSRIDTAST